MNQCLPIQVCHADQSSLIVGDEIVNCLIVGIIAAEIEPAAKLWLLWRWHTAGCSHRWIPYHPAMVIEIGYSDPGTGERLMRSVERAGYVDVEETPGHRGWYFVRITERVLRLGNVDGNQGTLFSRWNGEIPPALGRLSRLGQLMQPRPLLVTDRKTLSPTATIIAWIARIVSPLGNTATIHHAAWGRLLRLHHAQIKRGIQRLEKQEWLRILTQGDGRTLIAWGDCRRYWDSSQIAELKDFLLCEPLAAERLLKIVLAGEIVRAPSPGGAHELPAPDGPGCAPSPGGAHELPASDGPACAPGPGGAHELPPHDGGRCAPGPGGAHGIALTEAAKANFRASLEAADPTAVVSDSSARDVRFKIFENRKIQDLDGAGQENIEHPTDKACRIADTEKQIIQKLGNGGGRLYPWFRFLVAAMVNGYTAQWYLRDGETGDDRPLPLVTFSERDLAAIIEFSLNVPMKDRSLAFIGVVKRRVLEIAGFSRDESKELKQRLQTPALPDLRKYAREINYPWTSDRAMRESVLTA